MLTCPGPPRPSPRPPSKPANGRKPVFHRPVSPRGRLPPHLWPNPGAVAMGRQVRAQVPRFPPSLCRRSAFTNLLHPFAICCPFQACASAIPAAASWRRFGVSAAGAGASAASLSCSRSGSSSAVVTSPRIVGSPNRVYRPFASGNAGRAVEARNGAT
jgi:hypothetical protein